MKKGCDRIPHTCVLKALLLVANDLDPPFLRGENIKVPLFKGKQKADEPLLPALLLWI